MLAFTSHTTPHPNVLRRAAQYTTLFVADVLGVAHAPRRLARAGVVVEDVPESNALVSADIAEVASAELSMFFLLRVLCVPGPVAIRRRSWPAFMKGEACRGRVRLLLGVRGRTLRCGRCDGAVGRPAGLGALNGGPPPRAGRHSEQPRPRPLNGRAGLPAGAGPGCRGPRPRMFSKLPRLGAGVTACSSGKLPVAAHCTGS